MAILRFFAFLLAALATHACVNDVSVIDGFGQTCADYAANPSLCHVFDYAPYFVAREACCACACSNNDTVTDSFGQTCSGYYDSHPEDCGDFDEGEFVAADLCCSCKAHVPDTPLTLTCGQTIVASSETTWGLFNYPGQMFDFVLDSLTTVTLTTCARQTQFDTILNLFQNGNRIGVNDDASDSGQCSEISTLLAPGSYQTLVSGHAQASGRYGIEAQCDSSCGDLLNDINTNCVTDSCYDSALPGCCEKITQMHSECNIDSLGDDARASLATGFCEEGISSFGGFAAEHCVDYQLTCGATVSGIVVDEAGALITLTVEGDTSASVQIGTCGDATNFDTVLAVLNDAREVVSESDDGCADNVLGSSVNTLLEPGTHTLRVTGHAAQTGDFELSAACDFTDPGVLSCGSGIINTLDSMQTRTHAMPIEADSVVVISTCNPGTNVDTTVTLKNSEGTVVGENDDASSDVVCSTLRSRVAAGDHTLTVAGYLDESGPYHLSMECELLNGFEGHYEVEVAAGDFSGELFQSAIADLLSVPLDDVVFGSAEEDSTNSDVLDVTFVVQVSPSATLEAVDALYAQLADTVGVAAALSESYATAGVPLTFSEAQFSVNYVSFVSPPPTPTPKPGSDGGQVAGTIGGVVGGMGAVGLGSALTLLWRSRGGEKYEKSLEAQKKSRRGAAAGVEDVAL